MARWRSESGQGVPHRIQLCDDSTAADTAYKQACEGTGLLWQGDFQNGRALLQALIRRADRTRSKARVRTAATSVAPTDGPGPTPDPAARAASLASAHASNKPSLVSAQVFHLHRQAQAQRARTLGQLLLQLSADHTLGLRRAPDVRAACTEAFGPAGSDDEPYVISLRELLGVVSAHEWRSKGVAVAAIGGVIHPHYGVFAPLRAEYLDLVAQSPLPRALAHNSLAWDIGCGTGVLAALLARRGVQQLVATDLDPRALACSSDNLQRLGLADRVQLHRTDLFPAGTAPLIVCNPPWLPARPSAPIERAVYDPDSRMLRGFLGGLAAHLAPKGEGWLVLSDLAELLGLRSRAELLGWIAAAGMRVLQRSEVRAVHPKVADATDPLHAARAAERTSLWRLVVA